MSESRYLNFDLVLERAPSSSDTEGQYRARVSSPMGEASTVFDLHVDPSDRSEFVKKIGHRGIDDGPVMRRLYSPGERAARELGGKLFDAVFASEVGRVYDRCREEVRRSSSPEGLRIRLRIDDQELAGLPWEFLHDGDREAFLSLSKLSPIVRVLDVKDVLSSYEVELPLRVLAMVSSPTGVPSLDVDAEYRRLESSMSDRIAKGHIELTRIGGTLADLRRALRKDEYHVFHFIGHGAFDERHNDGVLVLEGSDGGPEKVTGMMLGTTLRDETTIQLAVLNACEGGRASDTDPFSGVAQGLVRKGTPAVIAMQFEISDKAAIDLSHEFYGALCDGLSVDAALAEGRKAIYTPTDGVEWGTPVLFMQNDPQDHSGQIFRITDPPERRPDPVVDPAPILAKSEPPHAPPDPNIENAPNVPPAPAEALVPPAPTAPVEVNAPAPPRAPRSAPPNPATAEPTPRNRKASPMVVGAAAVVGAIGLLGLIGALVDDGDQPDQNPVVLAATAEPTAPPTAVPEAPEPAATEANEAVVEQQVDPTPAFVEILSDNIAVLRIDRPPVIDGRGDEWTEIDYYSAHSVIYRENWDGTLDAQAFFAFAHDDNNLYMLTEIKDDVHDQINEGGNIFRGDALNLNIASAQSAERSGPAPTDVQITMAMSNAVGATVHWWRGGGSFFSEPLGDLGVVEFAVREVSGGPFVGEHYLLEASIPKSALPADAGLILASINDSDGEHAQTVVLSHLLAQPDLSVNANPIFQSPNRWGQLTFE